MSAISEQRELQESFLEAGPSCISSIPISNRLAGIGRCLVEERPPPATRTTRRRTTRITTPFRAEDLHLPPVEKTGRTAYTIPTVTRTPRSRRQSTVPPRKLGQDNGNEMVATASGTVQTLFDFTRGPEQTAAWTEHSDTIRSSGMSKATMVTQKTQMFQRVILFTLFNPQPNGTGFASVRCDTSFDLSELSNITIRCRGQGINVKYKMLLRHKGLGKDSAVYGQIFSAPEKEFATVRLPLGEFKPYHRGLELPLQTNPLDIAAITNVGLKVDNGQYLPDNHPGVAALEIDWIKATKSSATT